MENEADLAAQDEQVSVVLDPIAHTQLVDPEEDMFDSWLADGGQRPRRRAPAVEQQPADPLEKLMRLTCARCHKLTHEGRVLSVTAELELPEFDLASTVGYKIKRRSARRAIILMVVDIADFDGSLPRSAVKALLPDTWQPGTRDKLPFELVLVVNKMDTLPRYASHPRIEACVKRRVKQAGLPAPTAVHLVSSVRSMGIGRLLTDVVERVGIQGDLWVVGAQNAGKSSLINALKARAGTLEATAALTTAPLPGTTLGLTPVTGLPLLPRSRCYDTPGVPHPYQLTSRLGGDDVKWLLAREGPMSPRTYRIGAGNTLFLGGVGRIDLLELPAATIYFTVWASPLLPLHVGKTETAQDKWLRFVGDRLVPPGGDEAKIEELGPLVPSEVTIEGDDWQRASTDVCIAGLGWVGFGLKGSARLAVWTHEGVAITTREALMPDYADDFERPGWSSNTKAMFKDGGLREGGGRGGRGAGRGRGGKGKRGGRR